MKLEMSCKCGAAFKAESDYNSEMQSCYERWMNMHSVCLNATLTVMPSNPLKPPPYNPRPDPFTYTGKAFTTTGVQNV